MPTTVQTMPEPLLQQVSERIECRTGLHFPPARFADLERGLVQAARERGCRDACAYAEALLSGDLRAVDLETLAGCLTIGETHFFRDPRAFTFLEATLLPELIAAKRDRDRRLRIWSAGCATGEEPYSLAILLHRLMPDLRDWHITILGTDINARVLARAAAGIYSEWSFRDTPAWVKERYFTVRAAGRYEVQPWLQRMVDFACLNLVEDVYPSVLNNTNAMDLIVCRNVLLYFAPARMPPVLKRFQRALVEGGQLVLGVVEASQTTAIAGLTPAPAPSLAVYRKSDVPRGGGTGRRAAVAGHGAWVNEALGHGSPCIGEGGPAPAPSHTLAAAWAVPTVPLPVASDPVKYDAMTPDAVTHDAVTHAGPPVTHDHSAVQRVLFHANLGELAEALVCCERALATAKTDPALHFLRAGILQELQRGDEALQALRNVLFLDPGHVLAHFTMANLCRRQGRFAAAAKHVANVRQLLAHRDASEDLPESGGLTVGRLSAILAAMEETRNAEVGTRKD